MPMTFYRCSVCKRERPTYEAAVTCEASHLNIVSVKINVYGMWTFPHEIAVTFTNGETRTYLAESLK